MSFPSRSKERPTSDFLRENLFNLLGSLTGKVFLDLFAGSGSVGLEASSRGAKEVYLIEKNRNLVNIIKKNLQDLSLDQRCHVMSMDAEEGLRDLAEKKCRADIVFADPPYNRNLVGSTLKFLSKHRILAEGGVIVIQHSVKETYNDLFSQNIYQIQQRKYGENALTFFEGEWK